MTFEDLKFDETMKLSLECLASLHSTHTMRSGKMRIGLHDNGYGRFSFVRMGTPPPSGFGDGFFTSWLLKAPQFESLNEACGYVCNNLFDVKMSAEMFLIFHVAMNEVDQIRMLTTDMLGDLKVWAPICEDIGSKLLQQSDLYGVTSSIADTTEYGFGSCDFNGFWLFPCVPQMKEAV